MKATKGSEGGAAGGVNYTGPTSPTYNIVGTSSVTQASQSTVTAAVNENNDTPINTYITTSQVTSALALERQIASQANLGS